MIMLIILLFTACPAPKEDGEEENNGPFTISYNGNNNTNGTAPTDNNNYLKGEEVTVLDVIGNFEKKGGGMMEFSFFGFFKYIFIALAIPSAVLYFIKYRR